MRRTPLRRILAALALVVGLGVAGVSGASAATAASAPAGSTHAAPTTGGGQRYSPQDWYWGG